MNSSAICYTMRIAKIKNPIGRDITTQLASMNVKHEPSGNAILLTPKHMYSSQREQPTLSKLR